MRYLIPILLLVSPAFSATHFVIFLADDMGYRDAGFTGGTQIKTPALDRLAAGGARLDQFYAQPLCSPTRAALITGRYPMRHGLQVGVVRPFAQYGLPLEELTLPQALRAAGYETAITGKWHLGFVQPAYLPTRRGFEHQYGHYNGAIDYFTHMRDGGFDWHRDDKACRDEGYSTTLIADEAVRLIRNRDKSRPMFLYVPFNAVHAPHQVPAKYKAPYESLPEPRRTYAGMLAAMDESIGRIVDAIDQARMREDTFIFFSSDNGGPSPGRVTDNGIFRAGKGTLYEGGVRVCALANWPGRIKPGSVVDQPLHMVDLYPTILRLAGVKPGQKLPLDGKDAWATLAEGKPSPHDAILLNTTPTTGAIRMGDWKLVLRGDVRDDGGPTEAASADPVTTAVPSAAAGRARRAAAPRDGVELFNLAQDPSEKTNLVGKEPGKVRELRARYDALAKEAAPPKNAPPPKGFKSPAVWGESP